MEIHPVVADRWDDLCVLFGDRGATEGCWCMYWRRSRADYENNRGDGNRAALRDLCRRPPVGTVPGLLAYSEGKPVGWCSVGPRKEYIRLRRARTLAPVDSQEVWCVPCFFVERNHRRSGVASALLAGAVRHAREQGASVIEGYPTDTETRPVENSFANTGVIALFENNGFLVEARRGRRVVMRRYLS